jgi:hypothetical protein
MNLPKHRAELDPATGLWTAIWPGGSSAGWATRKQAADYAESMRVPVNRTPLDLRGCRDTD